MPAASDDRRLLLFATVFVVIAGLLVAAAIWFATRRDAVEGPKKPVFLGLEDVKKKDIRNDGPQYVANPFGDAGFWLDLDRGELVAYVLTIPRTDGCTVKWVRTAYVDRCTDREIDPHTLAQYPVIIGSRDGSPAGSVFVDLRREVQPAGPGG